MKTTAELRKEIGEINKNLNWAFQNDSKMFGDLSRRLDDIKRQISENASAMLSNLKVGSAVTHTSFGNQIFHVEKIMKKNIHVKSIETGKRYKVSAADIDLIKDAKEIDDLYELGF
jgi:hypothetical protein